MEEKPKKLERFTEWMLWVWTAPLILFTVACRLYSFLFGDTPLPPEPLGAAIMFAFPVLMAYFSILIAAFAALRFFIVSRRRGLKPVRAAQGLIVFGATLLACLLIDWPGITGFIFDGKLPFLYVN